MSNLKEIDGGIAKLQSILNRIQPRKQQSNTKSKHDSPKSEVLNPPEGASGALGKQLGEIFIHLLDLILNTSQEAAKGGGGGGASEGEIERRMREWQNLGNEIIQLFSTRNINLSVIHNFYLAIQQRTSTKSSVLRTVIQKWWYESVIECETVVRENESNRPDVIGYTLGGFVKYLFNGYSVEEEVTTIQSDNTDNIMIVSQSYQSLHLPSSRSYLIREFTQMSFEYMTTYPSKVKFTLQKVLTPLVAVIIISSPQDTPTQREESQIFLSCIFRGCNNILLRKDDGMIWDITSWLIKMLELLYDSSLPHNDLDHVHSVLDLGYGFIQSIMDLITTSLTKTAANTRDKTTKTKNLQTITSFLNVLSTNILLMHITFHQSSSRTSHYYVKPSLRSLWKSMKQISTVWNDECDLSDERQRISSVAIYRLIVISMTKPEEDEISYIIDILLTLLQKEDEKENCYGSMVWGAAHSLACMHMTYSSSSAEGLFSLTSRLLSEMKDRKISPPSVSSRNKDIFELFNDSSLDPIQRSKFIKSMCQKFDSTAAPLSTYKQCEALMLGLSVFCTLQTRSSEEKGGEEHNGLLYGVFVYLDNLLKEYPHLGIRSLPVFITCSNQYLIQGHTKSFLKTLEFISSTVARDVNCAHEIWSMLSDMMTVTTPINVQCMTMRLFPRLCQSNKRLYGRIRDVLGTYISHPSVDLRVAASATICDLAKEDLIRDVTEVIGWVQALLTDEDTLVVHFAILSLHYFVIEDELDYTIVIKVLKKKLVNLANHEEVLKLSEPVLGALVILLGDGEDIDDSDSSDDSDDSEDEDDSISPQIQSSVSALITLALSITSGDDAKLLSNSWRVDILSSICKSLTNYSMKNLEVDENSVKEMNVKGMENEDGISRYNDLKRIVQQVFGDLSSNAYPDDEEGIGKYSWNAIKLASKLLQFEKYALGPYHWKNQIQRGPLAIPDSLSQKLSKDNASSLIDLHKKFGDDLYTFTGSAVLRCLKFLHYDNVEDVILLTMEVIKEVEENDSLSLTSQTIIARTLISTMTKVWNIIGSREEGIENENDLINEIIEVVLMWKSELNQDCGTDAFSAFTNIVVQSLLKLSGKRFKAVSEETIKSVWLICCERYEKQNSSKAIEALLVLVQSYLDCHGNKKLEAKCPSLLPTLEKLVVEDFFPGLCSSISPPYHSDTNISRDAKNTSVWQQFYSCLTLLPVTRLEELNFFSFQDSEGIQSYNLNIARANAVCFLQNSGVLASRGYRDITKAQMWVAKQCFHFDTKEESVLWFTASHLSHASVEMSSKAKLDLVNSLFDVFLIKGFDSMCFNVIATNACTWSCPRSSFESFGYGMELISNRLDEIYELPPLLVAEISKCFLQYTPQKLGYQLRHFQNVSIVMNRALQAQEHKSAQNLDQKNSTIESYLFCLHSIILRSNEYSGANGQRHSSFIVSLV